MRSSSRKRLVRSLAVAAVLSGGMGVANVAFGDSESTTHSRYIKAFDAYRDCLRVAGYRIFPTPSRYEPSLLDWRVPDDAVQSGDDEACYVSHLQRIDIEFQAELSAVNEEREDAQLELVLEALRRCASDLGHPQSNESDLATLTAWLVDHGQEPLGCAGFPALGG